MMHMVREQIRVELNFLVLNYNSKYSCTSKYLQVHVIDSNKFACTWLLGTKFSRYFKNQLPGGT
eukprot:SAG31_NODE_2732_length_5173_cov_18.479306_3_plen_64_part_00